MKKKKLPVLLAAIGIGMLVFATAGSTRATLTYLSDNYLAQIDVKSIGVTLIENGSDVSWRDYQHKDDAWNEATGVLLSDMLENAGDKEVVLGKKYDEQLAVKNSGTIDQYVRVTVNHYWADEDRSKKRTDLDPSMIQIHFTNDGWVEDGAAASTERNVLYYTSVLSSGQTSPLFVDSISINSDLAKLVSQTSTTNDDGTTTIESTFLYDDAQFVLEATVDAVQTHNAKEAIKSAWGVDVNVSDDGSLSIN